MAKFHPVKIKEIKRETPDAVSVSFDIPEALSDDFQFESGQYINVKIKLNGNEEIRSYSLCSSPETEDEHRVAIKQLEGGKASTFFNESARVGEEIEVSEPEGNFTVDYIPDEGREHVFFAAGSGITPVRSMIKSILKKEQDSRCILFFGNRNEEHIIFKDEINKLAEEENRFEVHHILSRPDKKRKTKKRYGKHAVGRIDRKKAPDLIRDYVHLETEPVFYLCGPYGMMRDVENTLDTLRVGKDRIVKEYFSTPDDAGNPAEAGSGTDPVEAKAHIVLDDEEFDITVEKGITILDACSGADIDAPYSCRGGVCSTCMAKLEEGEAAMRLNYVLTEDEVKEGYILTCQALPLTPKIKVNYDE